MKRLNWNRWNTKLRNIKNKEVKRVYWKILLLQLIFMYFKVYKWLFFPCSCILLSNNKKVVIINNKNNKNQYAKTHINTYRYQRLIIFSKFNLHTPFFSLHYWYCQKYEHFIIFFFATGQFPFLNQSLLLFHLYLYTEHIFFLNFLSLFH